MLGVFQHVASPGRGSLVAGKYRLVDQLGVGATGTVWRGVHVTLGSSVAVKVLRLAVVSSPEAHARFEREAVICAHLGEASRHIARVYDYGVLEDGSPFVVMELLKGETLADRMRRDARIPLAEAAEIVTQLARALTTAHKASVLHRDLKPANVFLCQGEDGELLVKLVDFGMAKMLEDESFRPTQSGELIGTPGFMSPEQITGEAPVDARSDLWSVAAMVYGMVTGQAPYGNASVVELGDRMMTTTPSPPSLVAGDLPREIDAWMARGLARAPSSRFQTATELADALATIALSPWAADVKARKEAPTLPDARASAAGLRALVIGGVGLALALSMCAFAFRPAPRMAAIPQAQARAAVQAQTETQVQAQAETHAQAQAATQVQPQVPPAPEPAVIDLAPIEDPPANFAQAPAIAMPLVRRAPQKARRAPAPSASAHAPSLQDQASQLWKKRDEL